MADPETTRNLLASWHAVHDRLASVVNPLDDEELEMWSYADGWTITKVLSHLGAGADIFTLYFDAATGRGEAPTPDQFQEFWDEWDAKSPRETAIGWREHTSALLSQVEAYDDDVLAKAELDLFGRARGIGDIAAMRLSEDTLHGWDIKAMTDGDAELDPDGVNWVVDSLAEMVGYAGKATSPLRVSVHTTAPGRFFQLEAGEQVSLTPVDDAAAGDASDARLDLPASAFVRLVYGRMDPAHTPEEVQARGVDLDALRATFPGV